MQRRSFISGTIAAGTAVLAGCLGNDTDHLAEFEANLEERGLSVNGVEVQGDDSVLAEFETEAPQDDIAAVGLAFVDQIDAGWQVPRLDGLARDEQDYGWHAEAEWAEQFLDGDLSGEAFGSKLSETMQPVIVIEDGNDIENITSEAE